LTAPRIGERIAFEGEARMAKICLLTMAVVVAGVVSSSTSAETIVVHPPQGISFAVSTSSPGDTILVMSGVYFAEGGAEIRHPLTIIGEGGPSANRIEIHPEGIGFLLWVRTAVNGVVIDGLTMTRYTEYPGSSRGVAVTFLATVTIRNCVFFDLDDPSGEGYGIGLLGTGDGVLVEHNLFMGGLVPGVFVRSVGPEIRNNTFTQSVGIVLDEGAVVSIANNLFFRSADAVVCLPGNPSPNPSFACNDVWQNSRNYFGCQDPTGTNGNIALDPLLCDPNAEDFRLLSGSPCLPENSPPGCGLIGAFGPCELVAVAEATPTERVHLEIRPNPVPLGAEFTFDPHFASATLEIYDLAGRLIEQIRPSTYRVTWTPTSSLQSGVYFARLRGNGVSETVKFLLIR
jgi:hypothetical protein